MKNADSISQQRLNYLLLVVLLAGLSGAAVFFVVTDKDIQVTAKDYRYLSSDDYFADLMDGIKRRILMEFSPQICENTSQFFHQMPIGLNSIMMALDQELKTDHLKWTRTEKEARARCLEHAPERQMRRACFVVQNDRNGKSNLDSDSFLAGTRTLIEVQIQIRDQLTSRPIDCDGLADKLDHNLEVLSYFSVYWQPPSKDGKAKSLAKLQKRNRGFLVAVPGHWNQRTTN